MSVMCRFTHSLPLMVVKNFTGLPSRYVQLCAARGVWRAAAAKMAPLEAAKTTVKCSAARGASQGYCDIEDHCICDDPGLDPILSWH